MFTLDMKKTRDSENKKAEESKFDFKLKLIVFRKNSKYFHRKNSEQVWLDVEEILFFPDNFTQLITKIVGKPARLAHGGEIQILYRFFEVVQWVISNPTPKRCEDETFAKYWISTIAFTRLTVNEGNNRQADSRRVDAFVHVAKYFRTPRKEIVNLYLLLRT